MADAVSKSWFAVFNNPQEHGYHGSPPEICERLRAEWCVSETRVGAWAYCIKHYCGHYPVYNGDGKFLRYAHAENDEEKARIPPDLHHIHMVLEDQTAMRFSVVKNTYAIGMHFEGTKGNKKQAEDYISKTGEYSEDANKKAGLPWEEIIYVSRKGVICGRQGQRSDLDEIGAKIATGATPREILSEKIGYYRYESIIRKAYYDRQDKLTPAEREVKVVWHVGESGSGKSYSRIRLIDEIGEENIYYLTDYTPGSMWDGYNGQVCVYMEDFKGEIRFGDLLRYLDKYKMDLHARYTNVKALWNEIHITSVLHPIGVYRRMLSEKDQQNDKVDPLLRRISVLRYHWKDTDGYHERDFPPRTSLETMRRACLPPGDPDYTEWKELQSDDELPY